jgi:hypothetical protein
LSVFGAIRRPRPTGGTATPVVMGGRFTRRG